MTTETSRPLAVRAAAPTTPVLPPATLGLTWRPMTVADVPALAQLRAAVEEADAAPFRTSPAEVAEGFDGAWKDHRRDTLAGLDGDGVLRASAQVSTNPGDVGTLRVFLDGAVHPAVRGRGVGRALVAWMDGRARQLLAGSGKELPARILTYLEDTDEGAKALYSRAGFAPARHYVSMRRPLSGPLPEARPVEGVRVVPWTDELDDRVRRAHNDAFADHWGSEPYTAEAWALHVATFAPTWSRVALDEASGEVAGYLVSSRYEHDWPVTGYTYGYASLLGVRRAWRGRGVAVALLASAMAAYRADGMQHARLDVDTANPSGAHGLYGALGFEVQHGSVMYAIEV
ncbi:GNAT family N-acetyltransferase [Cellulomonas sp. P22]|uniref:GNAT family N-acetyltransferase n=1 Tax=Cellulomonas sp. P22 TaxID=3373189 RepID=UPI0037AB4454